MTQTTGHNAKIIALIVIMFIVSGLAEIHSTVSPHTATIIDTISSILLFIEHMLNGNTANLKVSTTSSPTGTE